MTAEVLEFTASELRPSYISSSRNIRFDGSGYIFEPKNSRLVIDLSSINPQSIILILKRLGGNGQFHTIDDNQERQSYKVISKISQEIEVVGARSLIIERDGASQGEISLLGIITKEIMAIKNWKYLLKNCSHHEGIRQIGTDLWASAGAIIKGDQLESITTDPPDMVVLEGNKAVFKVSCKITDLTLKKTISILPVETLFPHREAPSPHLPLKLPSIPAKVPMPAHKIVYTEPISRPTIHIAYNSDKDTNFTSKYKTGNKLVKSIVSSGEPWLVLKKNGVFTTPLTTIDPRQTYSFIFDGKRVGGNGRVYFNFYNAANQPVLKEAITLDRLGVREHRIMTPAEPIVSMSWSMEEPDCVGEVLFRKMTILPASNAAAFLSAQKNPEIFAAQNTYLKDIILPENKRFVIVIPSYKNSTWCEKNILSCLTQNYSNYRIIFTDDCSPDDTFEKVSKVVENHFNKSKVTLVKNTVRKGALENLYDMIWSCEDEEIVVSVDGDDWLAHDNVLNKLNEVYSNDVWITWGQYANSHDGGIGISRDLPLEVIKNNSYRKYEWVTSHLRTFYTWLFKNIKKEDLFYQGKFGASAYDQFIYFPMLEMAGVHSKFVNEIFLLYNLENPLNDHKVDVRLQQDLARYVRNLPRYQPLPKPSLYKKIQVALCLIATGKYDRFLQGIISSADSYFLKNYDVTYYIFSDKEPAVETSRKFVYCPVVHAPFPFASMNRFEHFLKYQDQLCKNDFMYYSDVDALFVDHIGTEILGDTCAVQHCGFYGHPGPVEDNVNSCLYRDANKYRHYFGGGFSGGKPSRYLELSQWCYEHIEKDLKNKIHPKFDDETALNTYFVDNPPSIILNPGYHHPGSNMNHYKKIWRGASFIPKILLLDKDHASVRSADI